jgi:quinoprotein glucose dehydrogenase
VRTEGEEGVGGRVAAVAGRIAAVVALATVGGTGHLVGQTGAQDLEWPSYGGSLWSQKYSPADQIDAENFADLEVAWRWRSADAYLSMTLPDGSEWQAPSDLIFAALNELDSARWRGGSPPNTGNLKATPLMVDGVLYLNTPTSVGAAVDARTGETLWTYNPKSYEEGTTTMTLSWNQRGVAYWTDGTEARVFWGTGNAYLICVDAATGRPCPDFGDGGRIDLMEGIPRADRDARDWQNQMLYSVQSPPIVVGNTVVTPQSISSMNITREAPPGWMRGFDARTGETHWTFPTIPQPGEFGHDSWESDAWEYTGKVGVWSLMSADEELGLLYLPVNTAAPDFYGGHRPGDNLFAESLVALDVETGERVWHYQLVHHGLWDYDPPAAPNLVDIVVDGRPIRAVAQITKQGFVFVFDRETGEPVWPIVERPVPTESNLEGEVPSPTQPFPTRPAPFEYQGTSIDDLVDFTPEIRAMAVEAVQGFRLGPLYTPPSLEGTVIRPGTTGGANWGGAAVDPETGILYVPSRNVHAITRFREPEPGEAANLRYIQSGGAGIRMPQGLPTWKPPYSRMTAIDLNTGEHVWMTPTGNGDRIRENPLLAGLDLPPLGGDVGLAGPLLTRTLLIYPLTRGGTDDGPRLVAYDKATGAELASVDLPGPAIGTPMTYVIDGRQHIAITVGGEGIPELISLALPD